MTTFSPNFLERIQAYPEQVQNALKQTIDEASIQESTSVLHGNPLTNPERIAEFVEQNQVLDTFLGRLMRSKKFTARVEQMFAELETSERQELSASNRALLQEFSDPERPYYHKLQELSKAEARDTEAIAIQLEFASLANFYRVLSEKSRTLDELIVAGLTTELVPLLSDLVHVLAGKGLGDFIPSAPSPFPSKRSSDLVKGLRRTLSLPALEENTIAALRCCNDHYRATKTFGSTGAFTPISVSIPENAPEEDRALWDKLVEKGLVAEVTSAEPSEPENVGHLALTLSVQPHPIWACYLGRLAPTSPAIKLGVQSVKNSWTREIQGYTDFEETAICGKFTPARSSDEVATTVLELPTTQQGAQPVVAGLDAKTCYAFLVCLDKTVDPSIYTNSECCLIVDGLEALESAYAKSPKIVQQKPVVLLSQHSPKAPHHVIDSVQCHWRYGGIYPTAPLLTSVSIENGRILFSDPEAESMGHMTLSCLVTLPMATALASAKDENMLAEINAGVFAQLDRVILKHPKSSLSGDKSIVGLERWVNTVEFTSTARNKFFLGGEINYSDLHKSITKNWPIAETISQKAQAATVLRDQMIKLAQKPNISDAATLIEHLAEASSKEPLGKDFSAFAVALSADSRTLLGLEDTQVAQFLDLVRQCDAMDEVATNLMIFAADICKLSVKLILPLFQLLASSLPKESLQTTLAFAVLIDTDKNRVQFRLAESIRRYGSTDLMLHYLRRMTILNRKLTLEHSFQRLFQRLLFEVPEAHLHTALGKRLTTEIHGTLNFNDAFKKAVDAGDRDEMLALMSNPERVRNVELVKWLDGLRSHSNELRAAGLPINALPLPQLGNIYLRKLASATFSDTNALEELLENKMLEDTSDLSLICRNIMGDNGPLNSALKAQFAESDLPPLQINGDTIHSVFAEAAALTNQAGRAGTLSTKPLVSVIVSAFNVDMPLLKLSIDSVLNQSHAKVEIFVVDDQSEAENGAEIKALADSYGANVHHILMEENSGPYAGRNRAIAASKGEFIAIQDADDWSHPDRFAMQLAAFADDPMLQLVTTPHIRIDRAGKIQMEARFSVLGDGPMTSMFRRSTLDTLGFFAPVRSRGDVEMRERIRAYFGEHALRELKLPMMLCFADSATLSQRTKSEKQEFLQLFRSNISQRRNLRARHRLGQPLKSGDAIQIPIPLRAPELTTDKAIDTTRLEEGA